MENDTTRSPARDRRRPRPRGDARLAIVGLATIGLLAAGCGGGSEGPGVASLGGTTTTVAPSASAASSGSGSSGGTGASEQLQFSRCMRANGVPDFPDPKPDVGQLQNLGNAGINTRTPIFNAAFQACKKYTPAGHPTPQQAADNAKGVQFSQCMRAHGVPNFPDPITGPTGAQAINLGPEHIDPTSPMVQAANTACQKIIPGVK